jgi:replication factor A1
MKSLNITFRLVKKGDAREVTSRDGGDSHRVADAVAGDSTGTVILSLWDDMIDTMAPDTTYRLENGYTSLFQGRLRLNIGKYGKLAEADKPIESVDSNNDMSAAELEPRPERSYGGGGGYGGGGYGRDRGYGGGGGGYDRGGRDRGGRGGGRDRRGRRY